VVAWLCDVAHPDTNMAALHRTIISVCFI
jgi:hypothetical protein